MLLNIIEKSLDYLFPVVSCTNLTLKKRFVVFLDKLNRVMLVHPLDKSINILKMIIKCLSVYPAGINYLMDFDFIKRFFPHQIS